MLQILSALIVVGGMVGIVFLVKWLWRIPVTQDPWDEKIGRDVFDDCSTPVCLNCAKPINDPRQHYCPNCGYLAGEYARYMPFVNIQFNYSFFGKLWNKLSDKKVFFVNRIIALLVILLLAPIMLVVGIPVKLYCMTRKK